MLLFEKLTTMQVAGSAEDGLGVVSRRINDTLGPLPVLWKWKEEVSTGVGFAPKNVWSRAARRHAASDGGGEEDDMAFGFKIHVQELPRAENGPLVIEVVVRWLKGNDSVLFESFCGMIKRKIEAQ